MNLLLVRHARAEDRERFTGTGQPDSKRPLTAKGIRRMKNAARGLRGLVPSIDLLASSSLRRALETAKILAEEYGGIECVQRAELAPGGVAEELIDWLAKQKDVETACLVGHEPDLSDLLAALLADPSAGPAKLKKGSVTLIEFPGPVAAAAGHLRWHRSAKDLAA
jgi:phosphohistidine phosphatase